MIKADRCRECGLPEPKPHQDQRSYVEGALFKGYKIDTRAARYVGIGNLHSVLSPLRKKWALTVDHRCAYCPEEKTTPPYPVDVAYMTAEQRAQNLERSKGGEA